MQFFKKIFFSLALCLAFFRETYAQEFDGLLISDYFDYNNELLWGINKNTNGGLIGGVILKMGTKIKDNFYKIYGIEIVNIKHPKEFKYTSPFGGDSFIWAKQNSLYALRLQYGVEWSLFNKNDQNGIQINVHLGGGPTLGSLVPYHIKYNRNNKMVIEAFDPNIHNFNNVIGSAGVFEGVEDAVYRPGIHLKTALNFEVGTSKKSAVGIEIGFLGEAFSKKMIIMPTLNNKSFFTSAFISLFYGKKW